MKGGNGSDEEYVDVEGIVEDQGGRPMVDIIAPTPTYPVSVPVIKKIDEDSASLQSTETTLTTISTSALGEEGPPAKKRKVVVGLRNLGNTCYTNAVVQVLAHTEPLRDYFLTNATSFGPPTLSQASQSSDRPMTPPVRGPRTRRAAALQKLEAETPIEVNLCAEFATLVNSIWHEEEVSHSPASLASLAPIGGKAKRVRSRTGTPTTGPGSISPHAFSAAVTRAVPSFELGEQHDAQEFLRCVLQRMSTEIGEHKRKELFGEEAGVDVDGWDFRGLEESGVVQQVFGGMLQNKIKCLHCGHTSIKPEPFLDLSLDIPVDTASCTIQECLNLFSSPEELGGETTTNTTTTSAATTPDSTPTPSITTDIDTSASAPSWLCPSCRLRRPCTKSLAISALPQVLCLHLKRFKWAGPNPSAALEVAELGTTKKRRRRHTKGMDKLKITTPVTFPLTGLDVSEFTEREGGGEEHKEEEEGVVYDAFGVVVHHGVNINSGHYTAYILREGEGEGEGVGVEGTGSDWWHLDDEKVRKVEEKEVEASQAYMIFYRKRTTASAEPTVDDLSV
ncbi:cysteine proteinase [Saitoella complicata NRRL Y-17804]|nr:cysteine proteinase [Saitoella complicata NRRL Y-17804]ODQ51135.1 cysteine proteinase [Saitoella complicata NRRL Y-17804]